MDFGTKLIDEQRLILKIIAGDKNLFSELYNRYKRKLMLTCLRYIPERGLAEDALQESFIAIYKDLEKFDESKGKFITWATRITINKCLKKFRKKSVFSKMDSLLEIKYKFQVRSAAVDNLSLKDLASLINTLPRGYRVVFNMYVVDGFTHKEIAEKLNVSESTSKTQLMRAKRLLKKIIKEEDYSLMESYA